MFCSSDVSSFSSAFFPVLLVDKMLSEVLQSPLTLRLEGSLRARACSLVCFPVLMCRKQGEKAVVVLVDGAKLPLL